MGEWEDRGWMASLASLVDMSLSKLQELVMDREALHAAVHGVTKKPDTTDWLNWTSKALDKKKKKKKVDKELSSPPSPKVLNGFEGYC